MVDQGTCRGCGAAILWVRTPKGKAMPLDPEPAEGGCVIIRMGPTPGESAALIEKKADTIARLQAVEPAARVAYVPHWSTCPQRDQFRKK